MVRRVAATSSAERTAWAPRMTHRGARRPRPDSRWERAEETAATPAPGGWTSESREAWSIWRKREWEGVREPRPGKRVATTPMHGPPHLDQARGQRGLIGQEKHRPQVTTPAGRTAPEQICQGWLLWAPGGPSQEEQ